MGGPAPDNQRALIALLTKVFAGGGLRQWVLGCFGPGIADSLRGFSSLEAQATSLVNALARSDLIDDELFDMLADERPNHAAAIRDAAAGIAPARDESTSPSGSVVSMLARTATGPIPAMPDFGASFEPVSPAPAMAGPAGPGPMATLVPHVRPAARKPTGRSLGVSHVALGLAPMRFVQLTGGGFTMGSAADAGELFDDRGPPHWVDLAGFHIAECPVTQYQWSLLMGGNPSVPEYGVGDDFPVQNMSWLDAAQFANALSAVEGLPACYEFDGERVTWHADRDGYRLPTEAEWEYAARAGTTTAYWFGDDPAALPQHGWYETNSGGKTHKVRSLSPNPWGLYDICGNVWEWVWDWYDTPYSTGPQRNPRGPGAGTERVLRGGAFNFWPDELQAASRSSLAPTSTVWNLGVRIARSALP